MRVLTLIAAVALVFACSPDPTDPTPPDTDPAVGDGAAEEAAGATIPDDEPAVEPGAAPVGDESPPPDDVASIPVGETGGMCGGIAGFQCLNEADYCAMPEGECVAIADAAGTCQKKPGACTKEYDPVCGCDGQTYGNACTAAAEGVSVAARGQCAAPEAEE